MSISTTGTAVFENEEQLDGFLEGLNPGSTVMITEGVNGNTWGCRWCPGKNIGKYFDKPCWSWFHRNIFF